jgi:hypothetical protein
LRAEGAARLNDRELMVPSEFAVTSRIDGCWALRLNETGDLRVTNARYERSLGLVTQLRDGEELVIGDERVRFHEPAEAALAADEHKRHRAQVARLRDSTSWMVYGDWLSERGDPWGQRIAERHTEWPPRLARLFPPEIVHPEWEYGHVYGLTMTRLSVVEHVELLALALFSRPAEFLVELTIERAVDPTVLPQLRRLLGEARLPALRRANLVQPKGERFRWPHCPSMPQGES